MTRRPRTAYHEAGHCLARLYFGHSFDRAIVRTVAECRTGPFIDDRGREVACEGLTMGYAISSPSMTPRIVQALSGTPAQRATFARQAMVAAEISLIEAMAGIVAEARQRRLDRFTVILTGGNDDWAAAKACAATWFPDDPNAAMDLAEKRAAALVLSPAGWQAIKAMATRLLADGALDGGTAEGIFAAAYGRPVPAHDAWEDQWPPPLAMLRKAAA